MQPVDLLQVDALAFTPEQDRKAGNSRTSDAPRWRSRASVRAQHRPSREAVIFPRPIDPDQPVGATLGEAAVGFFSRGSRPPAFATAPHPLAVIPPYFTFQL